MKHESESTNENPERDVGDVESLLKSMSLKTPPTSLDDAVENLPIISAPSAFQSWPTILAFAATALIAGFLMGRYSAATQELDWRENQLVSAHSDETVIEDRNRERITNIESFETVETKRKPKVNKANGITNVSLVDQGLYFFNGQVPVRKYVAHSNEEVEIVEASTGQSRRVTIPVRKTIVAPSPGI